MSWNVFFASALIFFAILLFFIMHVLNKSDDDNKSDLLAAGGIGAIIAMLLIGGFSILIDEYNPPITPMDVYQGKTTLKITYIDNTPVDSIVVLKK